MENIARCLYLDKDKLGDADLQACISEILARQSTPEGREEIDTYLFLTDVEKVSDQMFVLMLRVNYPFRSLLKNWRTFRDRAFAVSVARRPALIGKGSA